MKTVHLHIKGLVQGVGFRPYVYALAARLGVKGYVHNSNDGVHIVAEAPDYITTELYHTIISSPPAHAIITAHHMEEIAPQHFERFCIAESEHHMTPDLMLTPDLAICQQCMQELFDKHNRRNHYPFITCIHCGPRYSITTALPYDRCHTTMEPYKQCTPCRREYTDPLNRRYYSQTNSCADCGINLSLYEMDAGEWKGEPEQMLDEVCERLEDGRIVAVKGIGGFLLLCDAQNKRSILTLRQRKHRPAKPLALLYADMDMVETQCVVSPAESAMLQSSKAPVVLLQTKPQAALHLALKQIAPGLNRIGVMLPYAPLLALIARQFGKPLVATSANISGAPIIYKNEEAISVLEDVADFILLHDRDIVTPQDDSVVQFSSKHQQQIMLRRSRGWAPNFYPSTLPAAHETVAAMGGELKASFGLQIRNKVFISQYLGDQGYYEAQRNYRHTWQHIIRLLHAEPQWILADKHPAYETHAMGKELSLVHGAPLELIQHHEAHAAAVLAENNLLQHQQPVLCLAWDGTGYGDDGKIWGSECFVYQHATLRRIAHLDYFPVLMGDKMSLEPRLSALAMLRHHPESSVLLSHKFNGSAWSIYNNALQQLNMPQTSSMGRFLDGLASLLNLIDTSQYEGHATMLLQALAETATAPATAYPLDINEGVIHWNALVDHVIHDLKAQVPAAQIALNIHWSLAKMAVAMADKFGMDSIAVSGGVWQNSLLVDLLTDAAEGRKQLYFHHQLPPNDECISFGQLARHCMDQQLHNTAAASTSLVQS